MKTGRLLFCVLIAAGWLFLEGCGGGQGNNTAADIAGGHPELEQLTAQIGQKPGDAALYFKRGNLLRRLGQDTLALEDYKQAVSLDSTKAAYYSALGSLLFDHKDLTGSIPWFEKAIRLNPDDPLAHLRFAKLLIYIQDFPKAFKEINTVLRQDVYNPEAYFLKGMIYKELLDTPKSISSFQTALNVDPAYRPAFIQLGQIYAQQGDPVALQYYDNAFREDTGDVFPLYAKGVFLQQQQRYEEAKLMYRECVVRDHQYADAYYNMAMIYMEQDSLDKALRNFDLMVRIAPADPEAYYYRGLCMEQLGRRNEAKEDFRQALVFDTSFQEARSALRRVEAN